MQQTGATIFWECLAREGVEVIFGHPGEAILPIHQAKAGSPIRQVLARHEQGAAHMADGYARASGRVGVVLVGAGAAATSLVTGLATAMLDSVPVVAVTGHVDSTLLGTDAFQEVDVTGVTLPITKHNYLVRRAEDLAPALREALALARSGRPGPVLVDITLDAQRGACELDWAAAAPRRHLRHVPPEVPQADLDRALAMIRAARRPVILAGHGVLLSGAAEVLKAFAETARIPVAATLLGLGCFPASHPLFLGFMGMHGSPWTNLAIQEADLVLAFGLRFDDRVTGDPATFAQHARKIQVEIDRAEIGKIIPVDLALHSDLRPVLERMLPALAPGGTEPWLEHLEILKLGHHLPSEGTEPWPPVPPAALQSPIEVLRALHRSAPDAVWVSDVGQNQMWEAQVMRHDRPRSLITSGGLGTMGFALPAAIGAKLARPDAEVWVVVGDGGIQMNVQELMTMVQERLKINVAVLNNSTLGMVRQLQTHFYQDRRSAVALANPDFVALAEAYGLRGLRAETLDQSRAAVDQARTDPGPVLIEFLVDPEATVYPVVPPGASLESMIFEPGVPSPS
jgi:acetolactate synthase-1/2/3 large subunit